MTLIELECAGHRFGLPLHCVHRVVPSAAPTALPGAPDIVLGVLHIEGEVVAVLDFFKRVGLPFSGIDTSQRLVLLDIAGLRTAIVVDTVQGVTTRELPVLDRIPPRLAGNAPVETVVRLDDGLCIVVDPERFLFEEEKTLLGEALHDV